MTTVTKEMFNWPHTPEEETYRDAVRHAAEDKRIQDLWNQLSNAFGAYRSTMMRVHGVDMADPLAEHAPRERPYTAEANAVRLT